MSKWFQVTNTTTKHKHLIDLTDICEVVDEETHRIIVGGSLGFSTSAGAIHKTLKVDESLDVLQDALNNHN